ncbi:MAG: pantoate--beta-alanine ligase [Actinomycetota bacterium]|nr:pantoate--beta-alanine ligase [Actinomycetota bacterium]MDH5223163.1 pantoate--beta-alanine ligase [Actinomycetota bacterium]MDH5312215.1 pantoate--beta-alanine ligase [Actinomycetota bacterium]
MDVIRGARELRARTDAARAGDDEVALVPTMGALHEGHRSLIRRARRARTTVVVTIFVNPRQFSDAADLTAYPRDEQRDLEVCEELGADVVWAPPTDEVYPPGVELPSPDAGHVGDRFEGASRPGHLEGVLTVVRRLFDVTGPCTAFFGEKDAQQLFLVKRMVEREALPVEMVSCPTIREPDGLALSSRNVLLQPEEREQAGCLFLALGEAAELVGRGERDPRTLVAAMAREIGATRLARLDYAAVIDDRTFDVPDHLEPEMRARALVAVRFPSARLIDNLRLPSVT